MPRQAVLRESISKFQVALGSAVVSVGSNPSLESPGMTGSLRRGESGSSFRVNSNNPAISSLQITRPSLRSVVPPNDKSLLTDGSANTWVTSSQSESDGFPSAVSGRCPRIRDLKPFEGLLKKARVQVGEGLNDIGYRAIQEFFPDLAHVDNMYSMDQMLVASPDTTVDVSQKRLKPILTYWYGEVNDYGSYRRSQAEIVSVIAEANKLLKVNELCDSKDRMKTREKEELDFIVDLFTTMKVQLNCGLSEDYLSLTCNIGNDRMVNKVMFYLVAHHSDGPLHEGEYKKMHAHFHEIFDRSELKPLKDDLHKLALGLGRTSYNLLQNVKWLWDKMLFLDKYRAAIMSKDEKSQDLHLCGILSHFTWMLYQDYTFNLIGNTSSSKYIPLPLPKGQEGNFKELAELYHICKNHNKFKYNARRIMSPFRDGQVPDGGPYGKEGLAAALMENEVFNSKGVLPLRNQLLTTLLRVDHAVMDWRSCHILGGELPQRCKYYLRYVLRDVQPTCDLIEEILNSEDIRRVCRGKAKPIRMQCISIVVFIKRFAKIWLAEDRNWNFAVPPTQ